MLLLAGLPLFFLELSLGQFASLGPNKVFLNISPIFMGMLTFYIFYIISEKKPLMLEWIILKIS